MQILQDDKTPYDPHKKEDDKMKCRKKFSDKKMITREAMFDLAHDHAYDIRDNRCDKESSEGDVCIIYECPGARIQI